jgi:hypothetical protein
VLPAFAQIAPQFRIRQQVLQRRGNGLLIAVNQVVVFSRLSDACGNSWHGVRRINCPENYYRKVFIVVFEEHRPLKMTWKKTRRLLTGAKLVTEKERLMY